MLRDRYYSSVNPSNLKPLLNLQQAMATYYSNIQYHDEWIDGLNVNWQPIIHDIQILLCKHIPSGSSVLEVGCGKGQSEEEIRKLVGPIEYIGLDLNPELGSSHQRFVSASADHLPFRDGSIDVVISMFVIEHLVFPMTFLKEALRVVRSGGQLITIAPNFIGNAMASERLGFSYGSGSDKLRRGRILDALLTMLDTKLRIRLMRSWRNIHVKIGGMTFPILATPRCLRLKGFVPDCDAVYPAHPQEIINFLKSIDSAVQIGVLHQNAVAFGLVVRKSS